MTSGIFHGILYEKRSITIFHGKLYEKALYNYFIPCHSLYSGQHNHCEKRAPAAWGLSVTPLSIQRVLIPVS